MTRRRLVAALLAAAVWALTGCAHIVNGVYRLDPIEYRVTLEENVMVPMRDGVRLATDVYRPVGVDRAPVIIIRTPYGKTSEDDIGAVAVGYVAKLFVGHGYAVIIQDSRGRYNSEGEFYPFVTEFDDGHDALDWAVGEPWCNGKAGSWGGSYFGFTQWALADNSPELGAMVPLVTTAEIINVIYEGGAMNYQNMLSWAVTNRGEEGVKIDKEAFKAGLWHLPLIDSDLVCAQANAAAYDDAVTYQARPKFESFTYKDRYRTVSAPIYSIAGWYDLFAKYQIEDFIIMREQAMEPARSKSHIVIGPWGHGIFKNPPEHFSDGNIARIGQLDKVVDFYDEMLKGEDKGVDSWPAFYVYVMGAEEWRGYEEWPPPGSVATSYYLHSAGSANTKSGDGELSTTMPGSEPADHFTYDPNNPVPTLGGPLLAADLGPKDQKVAEVRDDVLVYTSEPLTAPVAAIGPISVTLFAATDGKDTDFTAKLCDVHPNGTSINIQDGIIRARFRGGDITQAEFLVPGEVYEYTIDLWHSAHVFLPGHKIRVQVSSSNFPRFDRNLNTGADIATGTEIRSATQTILHDPEHPSRLTLSVAP